MFLVTSPTVINVPTRGLFAVETTHAIVQWLENLNIKRNMTSMFVTKKHRYTQLAFHTTQHNSAEIAHKNLWPILVPSLHVKASDFLDFIEYFFSETFHNNLPVTQAKQLG